MASLTPVASSEALIEALEKSALLSAAELEKVREAAATASDPKALARDLVKAGTLTRWQAGQLLHGYYVLTVGKFKLLDQIELGETGRVYLAEHVQMGRKHWLKILSRRHTSKPEVVKRFLDEAQQASALDHRNLSHIYDIGQDGEKYYLVMEQLEGQSLEKLVAASGKLPAADALAYIQQAAAGLAHAHEIGVIHGDLKPSNLYLEPDGTIKIANLGQSRLAEAPTGGRYEESVELPAPSTSPFQAPEQRAAIPTADVRSDVYALGSTLCYLLTGKTANDAKVATVQLASAKDVPADVAALCQRLMASMPADRPQTMAEVQELLAGIAPSKLGAAPPEPAKPAAETVKSSGEKPSPPLPKAKKPPVAKALPGSPPVAKRLPEDEDGPIKILTGDAHESHGDSSDSPLAGLAIKPVEKSSGASKPSGSGGFNIKAAPPAPKGVAVKGASKATPAKSGGAKAGEEADDTGGNGGKGAKKRNLLPYILAGAIGGGVLVLGGIALTIYLVVAWAMAGTEELVADAAQNVEEVLVETEEPAVEGEAAEPASESNPEVNPEANPEVNPEVEAPGPAATAATNEKPAPVAGQAEPPKAEPSQPETTKTEPAKPNPSKTESPKPEPPKAEPPKTEPPKPAPATPEPPKPAPAKPAAPKARPTNPLLQLPKTVSLPPLDPTADSQPPEVFAPQVLGPHTVGDKDLMIVYLNGGEGAIKGGRQKFELAAANSGTAERDWEISLTGGEAPVVVALVSAKEKQLSFQWTEAAAKQQAAPLLCNCYLEISVGEAKHDLALRTPVTGQPLQVEIEKRGSEKWTIDHLPDPKKVYIEVTRLEGAFTAHKIDTPRFEASMGTTIWTGMTEDSMPLAIKLDGAVSSRQVSVESTGQFKLSYMDKAQIVSKKNLAAENQRIIGQQRLITTKLQALGRSREKQKERDALTTQVNEATAAGEQLASLQGLIQSLQGASVIHFRVYYDTGATPVELMTTGAEPMK